jgi:hypothetical protein
MRAPLLLADAVGPCPPLFQAHHRGCVFEPTRAEVIALAIVLLVVAAIAGVVAIRGSKADGE